MILRDIVQKAKPIWSERLDTGGMFDDAIKVWLDPDEHPDGRYVKATFDGWGRHYGTVTRHQTLAQAKTAGYEAIDKEHGYI